MAFFKVLKTINDFENGIHVLAQQVIECSNTEWVDRMGSRLLNHISASKAEGLNIIKIKLPNTEKKVGITEEIKTEEINIEKQKVVKKAPMSKVVLGDSTK